MPNWVINKIKSSRHVIESILDKDFCVDFNRIIAFDGEFPWDEISGRAKYLAEALTRNSESDYVSLPPVMAPKSVGAIFRELSDEEFEQFVQSPCVRIVVASSDSSTS